MKLPSIIIALAVHIMAQMPIMSQEKASLASEKTTVKLLSGETVVGKVAGIRDDSLSLATDYGVISIPVSKITDESRKTLNIPEETDVAKLKNRIAELEALVANLREENSKLREKGLTHPLNTTSSPQATVKPNSTGEAGVTYKLSNSGKRHNSRCRYFGGAGNACGPNDGVACKVCGG